MSFWDDFFKKPSNKLTDENDEENKKMTEEEILEAIDNLDDKEITIIMELDDTKGYTEKDKMVSVEVPGCWSLFQYIGLPNIQGLENLQNDKRIYFTLPCGYDWEDGIKFWYLSFPLGGKNSEIYDYYTSYNILDAISGG